MTLITRPKNKDFSVDRGVLEGLGVDKKKVY